MNASRPAPTYRKILLAIGVVLGLSAVILIIAVGALVGLRIHQEVQEVLQVGGEPPQKVQQVQHVPQEIQEMLQEDRGTPQEIRLVDIVPSPRVISLNGSGDSQRLSVQGYYSDGSIGELGGDLEAELFYTSSDPSVSQVDPGGVVTAIKAGGADITVSYGAFNATVPVLVWGPVRRIPPIDPDRLLQVADDGSAIVLNRVMVKLEPDYGPKDAAQIATSIGGEVVFEFRTFPGYVVEFDARTEEDLEEALAVLMADGRVAVAYPDVVVPASQGPPIESMTHASNTTEYDEVGLYDAWRRVAGLPLRDRKWPLIAVIDLELPRPGLTDPLYDLMNREFTVRFIDRKDWPDPTPTKPLPDPTPTKPLPDPTPTKPLPDPNYRANRIHVIDLVAGNAPIAHGVGVTSILVARNNNPPEPVGSGFSGVVTSAVGSNYELVFYAVGEPAGGKIDKDAAERVLTHLSITNGLEHVEPYSRQIDVVNMSFAVSCEERKWWRDECQFYDDWLDLIKSMSDITFVVGAGNANEDIDGDSHRVIPAQFAASLDNVIAVGGTFGGGKDGHSNYGSAVTLGAPYIVWGVDTDLNAGYNWLNGTSYSAPLVSGTVALLKAVDESLTPGEIKNVLKNTGAPFSGCDKERVLAWPDGDETKWKLLDAGSAVNCVLSLLPPPPPTATPRPTAVCPYPRPHLHPYIDLPISLCLPHPHRTLLTVQDP